MIVGGRDEQGTNLATSEVLNEGLFEQGIHWPEQVSQHCMTEINGTHVFLAGGEGVSKDSLALREI